MSDWIELKDLQAVAKAQAEGWVIEGFDHYTKSWKNFDSMCAGTILMLPLRGRPKAERKVVRVRDGVFDWVRGSGFEIRTCSQGYADACTGVFIGWVKGSEWREVEYE